MWHEYEFDGKAEKVAIRLGLVAKEGFLENRGSQTMSTVWNGLYEGI